MPKHIALIGLKGSGKSSVGQLLAEKLQRDFVDTDSLIEQQYQQQSGESLSFAAIYQSIGEQRFRELEQQVIANIAEQEEPLIIATGGSSMLNPDNAECLSARALVVYLQASPDTLLARWQRQPPSFVDPEQLEEQLQAYYQQREKPYHQMADTIVVVDHQSLADISDAIIQSSKE